MFQMQRERPHSHSLALALAASLIVAGCASGPRAPADDTERDGPGDLPPAQLMDMPDAEPRVEMIRTGGPNKPYAVFVRAYVPVTTDQPFVQRGLASWYGRKFHGRPTASGELYNMYSMTAAHPTLPIPSFARVRNPANGREVIVRVNDRGPFHGARAIDLSYTAALKLGLLRGVAPVQIERLTHDEIRDGSWRGIPSPAPETLAAGPAPAPPAPAPEATPAPPAAQPVAADALPITQETARARVPGAVGYWVQLGAFKAHDGAVALQQQVMQQLEALTPLLAIFNEGAVHRLQAGPYATREAAADAAQRVRSLFQVAPIIVQRR